MTAAPQVVAQHTDCSNRRWKNRTCTLDYSLDHRLGKFLNLTRLCSHLDFPTPRGFNDLFAGVGNDTLALPSHTGLAFNANFGCVKNTPQKSGHEFHSVRVVDGHAVQVQKAGRQEIQNRSKVLKE